MCAVYRRPRRRRISPTYRVEFSWSRSRAAVEFFPRRRQIWFLLGSAPDPAKYVGLLGNVNILLQRQRIRDSQCTVQWHMQDLVNGEVFRPFSEPTHPHRDGDKGVSLSPREIFKFAASQSPSKKNYDASTNQSNNFGVSRKRFQPPTPGSILQARTGYILCITRSMQCTMLVTQKLLCTAYAHSIMHNRLQNWITHSPSVCIHYIHARYIT